MLNDCAAIVEKLSMSIDLNITAGIISFIHSFIHLFSLPSRSVACGEHYVLVLLLLSFYFLCRLFQLVSLVLSSSAFYSMVRIALCSWWILSCALSFVVGLVVCRCLVFPFRCLWSFSFSAVWIFGIPISSVPLFLFPCRIHSMRSIICRSGVGSGLIRSGLFAVVRFLRPYLVVELWPCLDPFSFGDAS